MSRIIPIALAALFASSICAAEDWPQWRGVHRDGEAGRSSLPKEWPTAVPPPAWTASVGEGYSSPVIANGRVYVMGRDPNSMETCLCFDASTGKPIWKHAYSTSYHPPDPRAGDGPKSTPTFDRDRVYFLGLGGMFTCLDAATGKELWKHDFAKEYFGVEKDMDGVDSWFPPCGNAASAIVEGNTVIVPVGGKKGGSFAGFDRQTGEVVWKALAERSSYGSPMIADLAGFHQLVGFTGLRMVGLNLSSHTLLWEKPFPAMFEQTITTPIIWKDRVIVTGEQKPTFALSVAPKAGERLLEVKELWSNPDLKAYLTSPIVFKDHLVGVDSMGHRLVCIDLASGKTDWTSPRVTGYVSLVTAGDRILAMTSSGEMIMVRADAASYEELGRWKLSSAGDVWSHLAMAGGKLYIKDKQSLICYDLSAKTTAN